MEGLEPSTHCKPSRPKTGIGVTTRIAVTTTTTASVIGTRARIENRGTAQAVAPTISAQGDHARAVTQSGGVKCPGGNFYGELGDGTTSSRDSPQDLPGFTQGVKAVASGTLRTCLLTISGSVKCWGYNLNSQLGDGTNVDRLLPTDVSGLPSGVCLPSRPAEIALAHCSSRAA